MGDDVGHAFFGSVGGVGVPRVGSAGLSGHSGQTKRTSGESCRTPGAISGICATLDTDHSGAGRMMGTTGGTGGRGMVVLARVWGRVQLVLSGVFSFFCGM